MKDDVSGLREYAKRYVALCNSPEQARKRDLWRRHNSLDFTVPPIYIRAVPYGEFFDMSLLKCTDPLLRRLEFQMASIVEYHATLKDDSTYMPWLTVDAAIEPMDTRWGIPCGLGEKPADGGAAAYAPEVIDEADINKIITRSHRVNEEITADRLAFVREAVNGEIDVYADRRGALTRMWAMDISTDLAKLRGLEQIMYDAYDRPEWLHDLLGRMQRGILKCIDETEAAGDFSLADHQNQAMPYAVELADPDCRVQGVSTRQLWGYMASQETTTFGPALFDEFMLEYQLPIMARFGLVAYGCCEDLTRKITLLRKIPNLRRIAVSPFANVRLCAEQIGGDYVFSYRPNPSTMISTGLDEELVRGILRQDFAAMLDNGCKFDITLKDVETIAGKPQNMVRWVEIVREEIARAMG